MNLDHIFKIIEPDLNTFENTLRELIKTSNNPTNQILFHIMESGGKRLRPALFFLICHLLEYHGPHRSSIAAVCEYIHTASLLHDDVIDNSTLRRNKPTVNSVWGDQTAVLAGDLIYAASCRLMVQTGSLPLIDTFAECIRLMSESELLQLDYLWKKDLSPDDSLKIIKGKTACLFSASCSTPAYLAEKHDLASTLSIFGENLGVAFQVIDDCLDYEGSNESLGKDVTADLKEGKVTLPIIFSLQSQHHKNELFDLIENVFAEGDINQSQKIRLIELISASGGIQKTRNFAMSLVTKSKEILETLFAKPKNNSVENSKKSLLDLCDFIANRKL